jgi:hypothetical protein
LGLILVEKTERLQKVTVAEAVERDHGGNEARVYLPLHLDPLELRQEGRNGVGQDEHILVELDDDLSAVMQAQAYVLRQGHIVGRRAEIAPPFQAT